MFKCQICHRQSKARQVQFTIITKKREKMYENRKKGFEIEEEKKVCYNCYLRDKNKNGLVS
jgi:hypothetical protein